ncbi:glutamate--cysteine ligase [Georgenia sunbinii]|uniref:glutamate--cysteine ligase n=1 Tax=Georgenia sunbinii TaxID=3117728 RepID=UPI002F26B04D
MRTVGVEEELLLVRSGSGQALSVAPQVLRRADLAAQEAAEKDPKSGSPIAPEPPAAGDPAPAEHPGSTLGGELQRQQVETDTAPHESMADLHEEILLWRARADVAARRAGARIAAIGTSPVSVEPRADRADRYQQLIERFGLTAREQLSCGCHVHVQVDSDEEAVAVLDRIRVWLPALLALSANSPYWQGTDSSYASFRSQVMDRWPSAGPTDVLGSAAAYHRLVDDMVESGVLLDHGMIYFDARPSHRYPTLEIRVADVCQDPADAVLLAALCRGLVETAAREWQEGVPAPAVPTPLLRLAMWQASRHGVGENLLDPITSRPRPAADVLAALLAHVTPALTEYGDLDLVAAGVARVLDVGNGADHQRRVMARTGSLGDVVAAVVRTTHSQESEARVAG